MNWAADKITRKRLSTLVPYARNSRTHSDAQIDQIVESIKEWGWTVPVLIDEAGGIIAGHGRVLAAERMGLERIPCTVAQGWTEEQKRAYVIADNKLTENGGWDKAMLASELGDLESLGFRTSLIGFSDQEFAELVQDEVHPEGLIGEDDLPEAGAKPVSKMGDVWICGDHRVMCGDSTSLDYVKLLCDGQLVDACWTDPPYNVNYHGSAGVIENDNMKDGDFLAFLSDAFGAAFLCMRAGAPIYIAHADTEGFNFRKAFLDAGFKLSGCLVWVKNSLVLGRSDYQWRHEPILYGWKPGGPHSWYGGRANTTVQDAQELPYTVTEDGALVVQSGAETFVIRGSDLQIEGVPVSTIYAEKPSRSAEHPTMKPVGLISQQLKNSTKRGDVVLDLFGGSGSTLIAAHKMGRSARLMEFDPKFVDVIVRRWQDFTGREALLEKTGRPFGSKDLRKKAA